MIVKEFYLTREDGIKLFRTYSDQDFYIKQIETGAIYDNAVDIESSTFTYEETDKMIERQEIEEKWEELDQEEPSLIDN